MPFALNLPLKFLFAIVLGAVIGLERGDEAEEERQKKWQDIGGVRVFSLISLLGGIAGFFHSQQEVGLSLLLAGFFLILVMIYYVNSSWFSRSTSLTTELAAAFTFLIGFLVVSEIVSLQLAISLAVVLSLILTLKERTRGIYIGIKQYEISAFLSFALIALVILPFLPNQSYFLTDIPGFKAMAEAYNISLGFVEKLEIINPFKLWFLVALVTGIEVLGYVISKLAGEKGGVVLTSGLAGFVSATVTIFSLAKKSKQTKNTNQLVGAAMFSNLTSYFPYFVLIAPLNSNWLVSITPTILVVILATVAAGTFFIKFKGKGAEDESGESKKVEPQEKTIFKLGSAVKFAMILVIVRTITKTALAVLGQSGFVLTSMIASFAGLDAIVINLAEVAGNTITYETALLTLLLGITTNLFIKVAFSFSKGSREFAVKMLLATLVILASGFASLGVQVFF